MGFEWEYWKDLARLKVEYLENCLDQHLEDHLG